MDRPLGKDSAIGRGALFFFSLFLAVLMYVFLNILFAVIIEAIVEGRKNIKSDMLLGRFTKYSKYVDLFEQISIDDLFTPRNRSSKTSNRNDNANASIQTDLNSSRPSLSSQPTSRVFDVNQLVSSPINKSTSPEIFRSIFKTNIASQNM